MRLPRLNAIATSRQTISTFGGYNHNTVIGDGEWWDLNNTTADNYPVLAAAQKKICEKLDLYVIGAVSCNGLCYVATNGAAEESGEQLEVFFKVVDDNRKHINVDGIKLTPAEKTMVAMGAYVIILPDKKWVNVAAVLRNNDPDTSGKDEDPEWGDLNAEADMQYCVVENCDESGKPVDVEAHYEKPTPHADGGPEYVNGTLWLDTSVFPPVMRRWIGNLEQWVETQSYIRLRLMKSNDASMEEFPFEEGDVLSAMEMASHGKLGESDKCLHIPENPIVLKNIEDDGNRYMVLKGATSETKVVGTDDDGESYMMKRSVPDMDYVIESGNRLWGCKYGKTTKNRKPVFVNEIYASKLGDFKNWNCFQGASTDSYAATIGADGEFTGAVNFAGHPVFFKENRIIEVYGAYPAQFQIQSLAADGVEKTSDKSIAAVNNRLYYLSANGVCVFDGSLPKNISGAFGKKQYHIGIGGGLNSKYYLEANTVDEGLQEGFVYDTKTGIWHKRDYVGMRMAVRHERDLYKFSGGAVFRETGDGVALGEKKSANPVEWYAESGDIGLQVPDMKYISRLTVRLSLEEGSEVTICVKYDFEDEWEHLTTITGTTLRSFDIPIRTKRCDTMRIRIEGVGGCKIYSITKTIEQGGAAQ